MKEKNGNAKNGAHDAVSINMVFENNALLPMLYGEGDAHLSKLEKKFNISAISRGNVLALAGEKADVEAGRVVLEALYGDLLKGGDVGPAQVDAAIRMNTLLSKPGEAANTQHGTRDISLKTLKKTVKPYTQIQADYMEALMNSDLVFALGPAGTGKTYIAVAMAVSLFTTGRVEKIILSRPAVEAGEKLGFLPGDLKDKVDPYLRPLYDALYDMIPSEKLTRYMENGDIEVAPLAFMRGRTFSNAFVILDEAQNTTPTQMKMFLTRLGERSRMVVTGDLSQTDLPKDVKSGLGDAVRKIEHIEGVASVRFSDGDVVRHALAAKIIAAYDEWDKKKKPSH